MSLFMFLLVVGVLLAGWHVVVNLHRQRQVKRYLRNLEDSVEGMSFDQPEQMLAALHNRPQAPQEPWSFWKQFRAAQRDD